MQAHTTQNLNMVLEIVFETDVGERLKGSRGELNSEKQVGKLHLADAYSDFEGRLEHLARELFSNS
jgi:hypothetical protein